MALQFRTRDDQWCKPVLDELGEAEAFTMIVHTPPRSTVNWVRVKSGRPEEERWIRATEIVEVRFKPE